MTRTTLHGPKDVWDINFWLYMTKYLIFCLLGAIQLIYYIRKYSSAKGAREKFFKKIAGFHYPKWMTSAA